MHQQNNVENIKRLNNNVFCNRNDDGPENKASLLFTFYIAISDLMQLKHYADTSQNTVD